MGKIYFQTYAPCHKYWCRAIVCYIGRPDQETMTAVLALSQIFLTHLHLHGSQTKCPFPHICVPLPKLHEERARGTRHYMERSNQARNLALGREKQGTALK